MRAHSFFLVAVACITTACSGADKDSAAAAAGPWLMDLQDLGPARVSTTDADLADPSDLWFVTSHFLPGMAWDDPNVDIPLFAFDTIAMDTGVADSGSCPYEQLDGLRTTWRSDCRSTQGYDWTGSLVRERWEAGGVSYTRWDSDLDIIGDTDDPEFDRLSVQGSWVYASGDDTTLVTGIQANVHVQLEGYWARASRGDPREAAWRDWAWTGHEELTADGLRRIDGHARLGDTGTLRIEAEAIAVSDACSTSPTGTVTVSGAQSVSLGFHGETDCRQCADVSGAASGDTEVCAR